MLEQLVIVTQFAAKQIERLQTMKCFYFIHPLVQERKPAKKKRRRDNKCQLSGKETQEAGGLGGSLTHLFRKHSDPSTMSPYASLNN